MQTSNVIQNLTAAEMSIAERTAGLSVATLEDPNFPKIDLLGALAWVHAKRTRLTLTFQEFMEGTTLEEISAALGLEDEDAEGNDS